MQCFSHRSAVAVGVCRACGRGVCPDCARQGAFGIVCSDPCAEFVATQIEMIERAKRVYAMGGHRQRFPGPAIIFILMGVVSLVFGVTASLHDFSDGAFPIALGVVFLIGAAIVWRRYRFTGLNV
jgi:hypothetical protein